VADLGKIITAVRGLVTPGSKRHAPEDPRR
jgi:hypothetical protein